MKCIFAYSKEAKLGNITVELLSKSYGVVEALKEVSFTVKRGTIHALIGENGAGKTTLMRLLCGELRPDSGSVIYTSEKAKLKHIPVKEIGFAPQELLVWPDLTCREQLHFIGSLYKMSKAERLSRSEELLEKLHLTEKADALAATLSGGMKRRLHLASALMHSPSWLILDEPEVGVDIAEKPLVRKIIRELADEGTTILYSSHNLDEIERIADAVTLLHKGAVMLSGSVADIHESMGSTPRVRILFNEAPAGSAIDVVKSFASISAIDGRMIRGELLHGARASEGLQLLEGGENPLIDFRLFAPTLEELFLEYQKEGK